MNDMKKAEALIEMGRLIEMARQSLVADHQELGLGDGMTADPHWSEDLKLVSRGYLMQGVEILVSLGCKVQVRP